LAIVFQMQLFWWQEWTFRRKLFSRSAFHILPKDGPHTLGSRGADRGSWPTAPMCASYHLLLTNSYPTLPASPYQSSSPELGRDLLLHANRDGRNSHL